MKFMATLDNQMLTAFDKEDSVSDLQRDTVGSFHSIKISMFIFIYKFIFYSLNNTKRII